MNNQATPYTTIEARLNGKVIYTRVLHHQNYTAKSLKTAITNAVSIDFKNYGCVVTEHIGWTCSKCGDSLTNAVNHECHPNGQSTTRSRTA